ncbi:glycosyltransferase [Rivularia sp. PCC 7116]|uniref:glycosyltransferase family 4 protein n=1 Tax=Rivularia sp. PCC 7116 TaxID=373994 RepID=UPI00029F31C0|nr:glycosyltransferase family 4 protein [Rivularia sp. PCC 7116]AFY55941.1 glycosyltransferase [Rivularia sp. PCC 7116]
MNYHIALNSVDDIKTFAIKNQLGQHPAHVMWDMSQVLKANIHQPIDVEVLPKDRRLARIFGFPEHWALARKLSEQLDSNDVIYCDGEPLGIPIATLCSQKRNRPKIAVLFHNLNRPKGLLALNLLKFADSIDLFVTGTTPQENFLKRYLKLSENRIFKIAYHPSTDTSFFTPKPPSHKKVRPLIASGGMEKRDYETLANATQDMDVDVKICAFSPNRTSSRVTFPKVLPKNMYRGFYEWCDLVQLYCDADLVVLPLLKNNYQAGLSTLFEAMACRRPIIITRSPKPGIINQLIDLGIVTGVKTGDSLELKQAINKLLHNPQLAEQQAQLGYEFVRSKHNNAKYVQDLTTKLISQFGNIDNTQLLVETKQDKLQSFTYQ